MRHLLWFLLASVPALAQPFTAGIKAGVPLTGFLTAGQSGEGIYTAPPQHYIIGGEAELHLPLGLGVEFDVLYRHLAYTLAGVGGTSSGSGGNWEFPLVLKYRFPFPVVRPYVEGGVAWNAISGVGDLSPKGASIGYVIGGGVDIHAIVLHISPELRFTRWSNQQISVYPPPIRSDQNQAEFLVGFTF